MPFVTLDASLVARIRQQRSHLDVHMMVSDQAISQELRTGTATEAVNDSSPPRVKRVLWGVSARDAGER